MVQIKGRIEFAEVEDLTRIISQILDEFVPTPGQKTVVVDVTIHEEVKDEQVLRASQVT